MPFAVFVTTPRAGLGFAVAPYTVEIAQQFETRAEAEAYAATQPLPAGVVARFDVMPSAFPAWRAGSMQAPAVYPLGAYTSHGGKTWRSLLTHNSFGDPNYAPGIALTLWAVVEAPGATAWAAGVDLTNATTHPAPVRRTDGGRLYELIQRHVTQFRPALVPALWRDLGEATAIPAYTRAVWEVVDTASAEYVERDRAVEA
jgi:hypothetical protein